MANTEKPKATPLTLGKHKNADGSPALVRLSYLHVDTPHKNQSSGRHEYSVQILIPKDNSADYDALKAAVDEQTKLHFPKGKLPPKFHHPIKDGDKDVNQRGEPLNVPGHWIVSAKTDAYGRMPDGKTEDTSKPNPPPGVVGTMRGEDGKLLPAKAKSGDYGRVSVNIKGYTTGDSGVGVYLNNLQLVQVGEPLGGGRKSAADEFAEYAEDEEDPLN
ncbi:MAG: DUF2815 family protein [Burkholderiales bacterium]|nr:DUF2815 family protein [Burkholderiales bacterium]